MSAIRIGWLPLGSIVMLRGERLPRMVVARMVGDAREGVLHEYAGCLYPLGDVDDEHRRYFDGGDVESVAFLGYKDAAEVDFERRMDAAMADRKGRGPEGERR